MLSQDQNPQTPQQPASTPPTSPQSSVVGGSFATDTAPRPAPVTPAASTPVMQPISLSQGAFSDTVTEEELRPVAVVQVLSPRGVEYVLLTILLFVGAFSFMGILISIVNSGLEFGNVAFPLANLLIALPLFALLFLRLKKAEVESPELKLDPSKRRSTQFTQVFTFLLSFFSFTGIIYIIFQAIAGQGTDAWKSIISALIIFAVSAGIFVYYWIDEHK